MILVLRQTFCDFSEKISDITKLLLMSDRWNSNIIYYDKAIVNNIVTKLQKKTLDDMWQYWKNTRIGV